MISYKDYYMLKKKKRNLFFAVTLPTIYFSGTPFFVRTHLTEVRTFGTQLNIAVDIQNRKIDPSKNLLL